MKKQPPMQLNTLGGSSLVVIFGVLCMTIFSLLALNTALAEQRLARASTDSVSAYYAADLEAEQIFAALRSGEMPEQVTREGEFYFYSCPISPYQRLEVTLRRSEEQWTKVIWQAVVELELTDETLPLYKED